KLSAFRHSSRRSIATTNASWAASSASSCLPSTERATAYAGRWYRDTRVLNAEASPLRARFTSSASFGPSCWLLDDTLNVHRVEERAPQPDPRPSHKFLARTSRTTPSGAPRGVGSRAPASFRGSAAAAPSHVLEEGLPGRVGRPGARPTERVEKAVV